MKSAQFCIRTFLMHYNRRSYVINILVLLLLLLLLFARDSWRGTMY